MQQTLFLIPHSWFDGPLLIGWLIIGAIIFAWLLFRHGLKQDALSFLLVIGIVALVIHFVLPQVEIYGVDPTNPTGPFVKIGLAIRGYGVCLLLAIVSGVAIILHRCKQSGTDPDKILTLAFWMTLCGIVGARVLYVVQKSDEFFSGADSLQSAVVSALDMTKGGLVVYGSLIGGMLAAIVFFRITKMPFRKTADLLAPGMVLGLAIGRIGCLMNGCCFGGVCNADLPGLQFPPGSPPYMQQLAHGDLLGMKTIEIETKAGDEKQLHDRLVVAVDPDSIAGRLGVKVDDRVTMFTPDSERIRSQKEHPQHWKNGQQLALFIDSERQGQLTVPLSSIAPRSLAVHPTQIYSAINAALLCALLWFFWTVRRFDGEVFALMLILYPIARFLLELVRRDESGLMGTSLTISQWVSVGMILIGFGLLAYSRLSPPIEPTESPPIEATA